MPNTIFERRLPNKNRHVFKQFMKDHQLNDADEAAWEYLKETKGRTATDQLEFFRGQLRSKVSMSIHWGAFFCKKVHFRKICSFVHNLLLIVH